MLWQKPSKQPSQFDQRFDPDVDQLLDQELGLSGQQHQPQTAADWLLGEFSDAALGMHTIGTLDEEDDSALLSSIRYGRSAAAPAGSTSSTGPADADLSRWELEKVIRQYSWNADQPEMLQAALAAGLYPHFAFVETPANVEARARRGMRKGGDKKVKGSPGRQLCWQSPQDGEVVPNPNMVAHNCYPQHR